MASIPTEELSSFANNLADEARKIILPYWRQPIEIISKMEHDRPIAGKCYDMNSCVQYEYSAIWILHLAFISHYLIALAYHMC